MNVKLIGRNNLEKNPVDQQIQPRTTRAQNRSTRSSIKMRCAIALASALSLAAINTPAFALDGWRDDKPADNTKPNLLTGIGIDQHMNAQLPMDLTFKDETGSTVKLGDLFTGRPVVLVLVYYGCPMLCTTVMNGMLRGFVGMPTLTMGKDYDVIAVSFDPTEKPELAAKKKETYVREYGRNGAAEKSWHFLTGDQAQITQLTQAVGFKYSYDDESKQYIHPSGITIVTPEGKISRYFFGIDYEPRDVRLALDEAGQGKVGSVTEHILLYCYHYDAATGKYGLAIVKGLRIFGAVFVLGMVSAIGLMLRRDKNHVLTAGDRTADGRLPTAD